jgi:hypothetical protein
MAPRSDAKAPIVQGRDADSEVKCHTVAKLPRFHSVVSGARFVGGAMSERSERLRKQARDVTRKIHVLDDDRVRALSLDVAQAYIALARNEEWLEGEVPPC